MQPNTTKLFKVNRSIMSTEKKSMPNFTLKDLMVVVDLIPKYQLNNNNF